MFILGGLALFALIYYSPAWPDAVDPKGEHFVLSPQAKGALAVSMGYPANIPYDVQVRAPEIPDYSLAQTVDDAFGWFPMLILAIIGGVALSAVIAYGEFFGGKGGY